MACVSACSENAITTIIEDGFCFPSIDEDKCIHCGNCVQACSILNHPQTHKTIKAYIALSKNNEIYEHSSSGGVFGTIADYFIREKKAVVVGAAINSNYEVEHIIIDDIKELPKIQGSKYVQSDCSKIFLPIKSELMGGKWVLFSGTPCQVAALRCYLGKDYERLICVDIVCHGVPSPFYFKYHMKKYYGNGELKSISFRTKDKYERYGFNLNVETDRRKYFVSGNIDLYYRMFLSGLSFRESCYYCPYANENRVGDITIGDCGNSKDYKEFYYDKTISTVYPITEKGYLLWNEIKKLFNDKEVVLEKEINSNECLIHPTFRPSFRNYLYSGNDYSAMERKMLGFIGKPKLIIQIKERVKRIIPEKNREFIKNSLKEI